MKNVAIALAALLIAPLLFGAKQANAHTPPPEPREYSAYGPFQLCSNHFTIKVGQTEAVHVVGDIVRIINDREILAIKFANNRDWFTQEDGALSPRSAMAFSRKHFSGDTPDAGRTIIYAPHGLKKENIRYALFATDNSEAMIVGATSFDGSTKDNRLLDRIRPSAEQNDDCMPLWHAMSRVTDDDVGKRVKPNRYRWSEFYPQTTDDGPVFYCTGGIGFDVKAGEKLRRPWWPLGDSMAHVEIDGSWIKIERRGGPMRPADSNNLNEHPMSWARKSEINYHPSRGVGPPYAAEGVREPGTWEVKLDARGASRALQISFPASEKSGTGFNFLERLQFVEDGDPRCGKSRVPK